MLQVYDADDSTNLHDLTLHDYIGSYTFQLSKVVSSANQSLEAKLEGPSKTNAKVKIMAEEKKENYGNVLAIMDIDCDYDQADGLFMVLNKTKSPGNYQPIYKTECMNRSGGKVKWNTINVDTDTLCNNEDDQEIMMQIFEYKTSGNHKKVT